MYCSASRILPPDWLPFLVIGLDRTHLLRHVHQGRIELHEGVLNCGVLRVARVAARALWKRRDRGGLVAEVVEAPSARQPRVLDVGFDGAKPGLEVAGAVDRAFSLRSSY